LQKKGGADVQKIDSVIQRQLDNFAKTAYNSPSYKAAVIQFPLWPEPARGVANVALRSALFAAIDPKNRKSFTRKVVAVQSGFEIRFTGIQLCQSDLDVWEQALHLARLHPLGDRCSFTAHAFLKALERFTGKAQHEWLKDTFARLQAGSVEITKGSQETYFGSLIDKGARDEITGRYVLQINPDLADLYATGWTAIDWTQRRRLKKKPLALWLHGFFATHAAPFPMKVELYRSLSGSQTKEKWNFKQNLKAALEALKKVGAIISYQFEGELLHVERVPSSSQQRHLDNQIKTRC